MDEIKEILKNLEQAILDLENEKKAFLIKNFEVQFDIFAKTKIKIKELGKNLSSKEDLQKIEVILSKLRQSKESKYQQIRWSKNKKYLKTIDILKLI